MPRGFNDIKVLKVFKDLKETIGLPILAARLF